MIWFTHCKGINVEKLQNIAIESIQAVEVDKQMKNEEKVKCIKVLKMIIEELNNPVDPSIKIFDPMNQKTLPSWIKLIDDPKNYIKEPSKIIKYKPTYLSELKLSNTIGDVREKVNRWLSQEKYGRIYLELEVLFDMKALMKEKYIEEPFSRILESFSSHFHNKIEESERLLNDSLRHVNVELEESSLIFSLSLFNTFQYIYFFKRFFQDKYQFEPKEFLSKIFLKVKNFKEKCTSKVNLHLSPFEEIKLETQKLFLMENHFSKVEPQFKIIYEELLQEIEKKIEKDISICEREESLENTNLLGSILTSLQKGSEHLQHLFPEKNLKEIYEKTTGCCVKIAQNKLQGICEKIKGEIDDNSVEKIKKEYEILNEIILSEELKKTLSFNS